MEIFGDIVSDIFGIVCIISVICCTIKICRSNLDFSKDNSDKD